MIALLTEAAVIQDVCRKETEVFENMEVRNNRCGKKYLAAWGLAKYVVPKYPFVYFFYKQDGDNYRQEIYPHSSKQLLKR
jgi:hypothetical protein